jgi:hypothetical protein
MNQPEAKVVIGLDEAIAILLDLLKNGTAGMYGYDLFPRRGAEIVARRQNPHDHYLEEPVREISPVFYDAAWELCRRGMVRPGVRRWGQQAVDEVGYSLTEAGRRLLEELDESTFLIAQPGALAATLASYGNTFGDGFRQRALEAIKCRNAEAWLGCCAMAGAAAESILLALAIAKTGDEETVLRAYGHVGGRRKVLNMIAGQMDATRRDTLTTFTGIISLWRDEAAHGQATSLETANADEALRQLLHMCQWVEREWKNLVG